jgi:UDP-N-acetylmuramyl pentapeptide phosphotransferase/UDP-N-acetylglucosamine-1-phosphate transferase
LSLTAPGPAALALSCGALGLYDDLAGDSHARGLRGHLAALRQRRVTTGMVKLAGLVTSGATLAATEHRCPRHALTDAALVAGTGNLLNLFDLRPGRALKVALGVGVPLAALGEGAGALAAAAVTGSAAALVPHDLREQVMIGDCGANALGAVLGWALAQALPPRGRAAALAAVVGLTLASERVSFSRVIESSPTLSSLDSWGRRQ